MVILYQGGPAAPAEGPLKDFPESVRWHMMFQWATERRRRSPRPDVLHGVVVGRTSDQVDSWFEVPCIAVVLP